MGLAQNHKVLGIVFLLLVVLSWTSS